MVSVMFQNYHVGIHGVAMTPDGKVGVAGAGKDHIARGRYPQHKRIAIADYLKQEYCMIRCITLAELEADKEAHRVGLQQLGAEMRRENLLLVAWARAVQLHLGPVVTPDIRTVGEYRVARSMGFKMVLVVRPVQKLLVGNDDLTEIPLVAAWDQVLFNV